MNTCKNLGIISVAALLAFIFLAAVPQDVFADAYSYSTGRTFEVYAYGSGNFLATIFNGIAMITNGGFIHNLVKIALLLALLYGVSISLGSFIGTGGMAKGFSGDIYKGEGIITIVSVAITAFVAVAFFLSPRANVAIIDRMDPSQTQIVANVPLPSAFIPHVMSTIGDTIGKEFEMVFSLPDSLQFRNGGIGLGAKYTDALMNIYPPNSNTPGMDGTGAMIMMSLRDYYHRCVFPNYGSMSESVVTKTAALTEMSQTGDLLNHLRNGIYLDPNTTCMAPNTAGWAPCSTALDDITAAWTTNLTAWRADMEKRLSGSSGSTGISGAGNALNLGSGALTSAVMSRYFADSEENSNTILVTIAAANLLRDSVATYLAYMGAPTETAMVVAKRTSTSGWLTAAKFFNTLVNTTRAIVEGLIYGLSVLLPMFFVFGGMAALLFYGKLALWLQLWVPFYVLINLYADMEVTRVMNNIFLSGITKSPSLSTLDQIASQLELTLGYVGSLSPIVPALAWGLVSGGAYAVTHAVQAVGGGSAPAAAAAAGAAVVGSGNVSMGNMALGGTSVGSGSVMSSQQGHKANEAASMTKMRSMEGENNFFGGPGNRVAAMAGAEMTSSISNVAKQGGKVAGHGGLAPMAAMDFAGTHGDAKGTGDAAKARAKETGESTLSAISGEKVDAKMAASAQTLGDGRAVNEVGFGKSADARRDSKLSEAGKYEAMNNIGNASGKDMSTAAGRKAFWTEAGGAGGAQIGVNAGNIDALKAGLKSQGLNGDFLKEGQVATVKSSDGGATLSSVQSSSGLSVTSDNVMKSASGKSSMNDNTNRDFSGNSKVIDNSTKSLAGSSFITDNSHKDLSGSSSIADNSNKDLSGTSSVKDNSHAEITPQGRYQNDAQGNRVSGVEKIGVTETTKPGEGAFGGVQQVTTGLNKDDLASTTTAGSLTNINMNRYDAKAGVVSDNIAGGMAQQAMQGMGMGEKASVSVMVGVNEGAKGAEWVAGIALKAKSVNKIGKPENAAAEKPAGGGTPSGGQQPSGGGGNYGGKLTDPTGGPAKPIVTK